MRLLAFFLIAAAAAFEPTGDVIVGPLGDASREYSGRGARLLAGEDHNGDGQRAGTASKTAEFATRVGQWYRLQVRGLAQPDFSVEQDALYLRVVFYQGKRRLEQIDHRIYGQVRRERQDLKDAGTNKNLGPATWRQYALDFRIPFAGVDRLRYGIGFAEGSGKGEFWIN